MPQWKGCSGTLKGTWQGGKARSERTPPKEAACWLQVREEEGYGAERGLC